MFFSLWGDFTKKAQEHRAAHHDTALTPSDKLLGIYHMASIWHLMGYRWDIRTKNIMICRILLGFNSIYLLVIFHSLLWKTAHENR